MKNLKLNLAEDLITKVSCVCRVRIGNKVLEFSVYMTGDVLDSIGAWREGIDFKLRASTEILAKKVSGTIGKLIKESGVYFEKGDLLNIDLGDDIYDLDPGDILEKFITVGFERDMNIWFDTEGRVTILEVSIEVSLGDLEERA